MPETAQASDAVQAAIVPQRSYDGLEKAILAGTVVDSEFKQINPQSVVDEPKANVIGSEGQKALLGALKPGEIGWIGLDEKGSPVGGAQKFPILDRPAAPVATIVAREPTDLATPAGAFLSEAKMNPSPASYKYQSNSYNRDYQAVYDKKVEQWSGTNKMSGDVGSTRAVGTESSSSTPSSQSSDNPGSPGAGSSSSPSPTTEGNPLSIVKLTKTNPSRVTLSAEDYGSLAAGDSVRLNGTNVPAADGQTFTLATDVGTNTFKLNGLDLSANDADVTTGTVQKTTAL